MPYLIRSECGSIVNIGGMTAHLGAPNRVPLLTAKIGLVGMTRGLAQDSAPHGVTVNCVVPGLMNTIRGDSATAGLHSHGKAPPIGRAAFPTISARSCTTCAVRRRATSPDKPSTPMRGDAVTAGRAGAGAATSIEKLADWTLERDPAYRTDLVLRQARLLILDFNRLRAGCDRRRGGRRRRAACAELGGPPEATVIGAGEIAALNAVLANGALVRVLDLNDIMFMQLEGHLVVGGHRSDNIPVALAIAKGTEPRNRYAGGHHHGL